MTFKLLLIFLSLLSSLLISFLFDSSWNFLKWLDAAFLVGLLLLMISSAMILIEGRFFVAFIQSTKNFFAKINKQEQLIRESEKRSAQPVIYVKRFPSRKAFFQVGMLFSIASLLVSSAIYFF
ncbi:DUF3899 domain-containing protein [Planococcus shenhongbingii]